MSVYFANEIPGESWLNEDRFALFRKGYSYATTQTAALPGLAKLTPEESLDLYEAIARGIAYAKGEVYIASYEGANAAWEPDVEGRST